MESDNNIKKSVIELFLAHPLVKSDENEEIIDILGYDNSTLYAIITMNSSQTKVSVYLLVPEYQKSGELNGLLSVKREKSCGFSEVKGESKENIVFESAFFMKEFTVCVVPKKIGQVL